MNKENSLNEYIGYVEVLKAQFKNVSTGIDYKIEDVKKVVDEKIKSMC